MLPISKVLSLFVALREHYFMHVRYGHWGLSSVPHSCVLFYSGLSFTIKSDRRKVAALSGTDAIFVRSKPETITIAGFLTVLNLGLVEVAG